MPEPLEPDPEITPEIFRQWRDARRGTRHAEDLGNPYWNWLIRSGQSSWATNEHFQGPCSFDTSPAWSFERFGQSTTLLPDGRTLLIAGEHEDYYDPDFFIYNDVIIRHPEGGIGILGFPEEEFPPTDFHSATLVDGNVVLIGNLGYLRQRVPGNTQVLVIDPNTWEIRKPSCTGDGPGWIHGHETTSENDALIIRGGKVWTDTQAGLIGNFDDWRLSTATWTWERLTSRHVTVLEFLHEDGTPNKLFEMGMWAFHQDFMMPGYDKVESLPGLPDFKTELDRYATGAPKDRDAYERRYQPDDLEYRHLPEPENSRDSQIEVAGVRVSYQENLYSVRLIIEGRLPEEAVSRLSADLKVKLERAEGVNYQVRTLREQ